jgi:hypothetical protein
VGGARAARRRDRGGAGRRAGGLPLLDGLSALARANAGSHNTYTYELRTYGSICSFCHSPRRGANSILRIEVSENDIIFSITVECKK